MDQLLRPYLRIAQIIFAFFLIYFAVKLAHYHLALINFPFADGLREGAMMTSTNALLHGLNPFAMSLQPQIMNQYGIVYPLLVWPWAAIFGITIFVHRAVTGFFILASCALMSYVLKRMKVPVLLNAWAFLMLYSSLMFPQTSTPLIDPGSTGMFFMLLTVFIPWFCNYSYKSLIFSIIFGLIAFYTKPYALLGLLIISSYVLLFVSRIKGIFYATLLLVLSVLSIIFINQIFPAYFDNCFFTSFNTAHAWSTVERLHMQIHLYSKLHAWTLVLMAAFIVGFATQIIRTSSWKKFKWQMPLVLWAGLWSAAILYISLGRHSGATLWYFFQLLSPFFLIGAVWIFSRFAYWPLVCIPFLIINLFTMTADQNYKNFGPGIQSWSDWSHLAEVIQAHEHVLNSPLIAPLLVQEDKEVTDDGLTEYFEPGAERTSIFKYFLKEDENIYIQQILFFKKITEMVDNKKYDLIALQPSLLPMGIGNEIKKYYKYEGQVTLWAPQDGRFYAVTLWLPL